MKKQYNVPKAFMDKVTAVLDGGGKLTPTQLMVCDLLGIELKNLQVHKSQDKGGNGMARERLEKKHTVKKVERRSGFGSGVSNFEALGHKIKDGVSIGAYAKNHPDCIVMIKDGEARRMDDTNENTGGHGKIAVVYRTGASDN